MDLTMTLIITIAVSGGLLGILDGNTEMVIMMLLIAPLAYLEGRLNEKRSDQTDHILELRNMVTGDTFNLARVLDELFRMRDLTLQRSKDALDDADRISNIAMYRAYISAIEIVRKGGKRYGRKEEEKGTNSINSKG